MKQRLQYLAVFKNLIESDYINDYRVFNYLKKKRYMYNFYLFPEYLRCLVYVEV